MPARILLRFTPFTSQEVGLQLGRNCIAFRLFGDPHSIRSRLTWMLLKSDRFGDEPPMKRVSIQRGLGTYVRDLLQSPYRVFCFWTAPNPDDSTVERGTSVA
ncbi:hypothetical protein BPOR_0102g00190 [Botrytis porri]|uniref:Uncharacterized protein n=1 Tax=Botrytis porri TaxID=87229 RepID=A0A4Z1KYR1_9HELO|nr:hypothetical protein BPOR_0102g00190 [Botrytis porri]